MWIIICLLDISFERGVISPIFTQNRMDWPLLSAINTCNVCFIHTGHQRAPSRRKSTEVIELMTFQEIPNMDKVIAIAVTE